MVEVKYLSWTDDNLLRQVVYQGLREDKEPRAMVRKSGSTGQSVIKLIDGSVHSQFELVTLRYQGVNCLLLLLDHPRQCGDNIHEANTFSVRACH